MFFVLDENHNLKEAYDKEGVLSALEKAIADGSLSGLTADSAFVSKIRCCVTNGTMRIAFVTQAKYNELAQTESLLADCYYIITDDTTVEDIDTALQELSDAVNSVTERINGIFDGSVVVPKADVAETAVKAQTAINAEKSEYATNATNATNAEHAMKLVEDDLSVSTVPRPIWFESYGKVDGEWKLKEGQFTTDDAFAYDVQNKTLKVENIDGKASSATNADHATNATSAEKTSFTNGEFKSHKISDQGLQLGSIYASDTFYYLAFIECTYEGITARASFGVFPVFGAKGFQTMPTAIVSFSDGVSFLVKGETGASGGTFFNVVSTGSVLFDEAFQEVVDNATFYYKRIY